MPQVYGRGGHYKPEPKPDEAETGPGLEKPANEGKGPLIFEGTGFANGQEKAAAQDQARMRGQATEPVVPSQLDPTPPRDGEPATATQFDAVKAVVQYLIDAAASAKAISEYDRVMLHGIIDSEFDKSDFMDAFNGR